MRGVRKFLDWLLAKLLGRFVKARPHTVAHTVATPPHIVTRCLPAVEKAPHSVETPPSVAPPRRDRRTPKELAQEIHRQLLQRPDLIGTWVPQAVVKELYNGFVWCAPYKDVAEELSNLMQRKRIDDRHRGKHTYTAYFLAEPAAAPEVRQNTIDNVVVPCASAPSACRAA